MRTCKCSERLSVHTDMYRIAGNFRGRKLSWIGEKYDFRRENFRRLLAFAVPKDATPQISQRKLLRITTKLRNSHKFSPSKVFRYTVLQLSHVKGYCQLVVLAWKGLGVKMTHAECIFSMSHLSARMTAYSVMGKLWVWPSCNKATCESKLAAECKVASLASDKCCEWMTS